MFSNELYYFGVRFYNPDFGIFMTPEPFVGADGFNLEDPFSLKFYDYCRNNPLKYFDPSGEYYLTQREGVFYVYRIPTIEAEARFALSFIPGASVLISLVRLASSDETLGQKDWAWAAAETATGLAGGSFLVSMIKYQCLHSILEIFARKTLSNSAYEMTSEYERALYLDDQIFRRLIRENEEYQLKAIDRGGNGGRVEINLGNSREDYSILKERLMKIAKDEAKWWLNLPPHNK